MMKRDRRATGRTLLACAGLAAIPAVTLAAAHPAAATAVFERVESAVTCATTNACVAGTNKSSGPGVAGTSASGNGVTGATKFNAMSINTATSGIVGSDSSTNKNTFNSGVYGTSPAGFGVQGYSVSNAGVYGHASSGLGVYGIGTGPGVYGVSVGNDGAGGATNCACAAGVSGSSAVGEGGYFDSAATTGIQVVNSNTSNPMTSTAVGSLPDRTSA
jgi:hypothetical protein